MAGAGGGAVVSLGFSDSSGRDRGLNSRGLDLGDGFLVVRLGGE